jgi:hypothetical protein
LLLATFAIGAGSLLTPAPAPAAEALFRTELQYYGAPLPPVTSLGDFGRYQNYIIPYTSTAPPGTATVQAGNFVGSPITLPKGFIDFQWTSTFTAKTAFPGYTTVSAVDYYNAIGRFKPNNGATAPTRVVFPTTMGNSSPNPAGTTNINYGRGNPTANAVTTTFGGRYDISRAGSLDVTPGANRFGGTMRFIYRSASEFYQYIFKYEPTTIYKAYGSFRCQRAGIDCTTDPSGSFGPSEIGEITSSGMVTRFLLNVKGTGTGMKVGTNTAKATTPITPNGTAPTAQGLVSYNVAKNYYLHLIHPWTTGKASAYNYRETPVKIHPNAEGYDTSLGEVSLTVTHVGTEATFNTTRNSVTYKTSTFKQYMTGVKRVISMVRPRLVHVFNKPLNKEDPISASWQSARVWQMKVYFVPEPTGLAMMGVGIAALLGLSRMRRR